MTELSLHNLKINPKAKKRAVRVGRGDASGHGSYSGRGLKGQRARSGGKKGLKLRGLKQLLKNKPKIGGFRSLKPKMAVVNLSDLENNFSAGEIINAAKLSAKGLLENKRKIKILGDGRLTKKLTVLADEFSESAKKAIIEAGGNIKLIK
ncbi:MAG TPA: 50S ribosomal protein L15 [Patescibacteria group bacterium]|nr:50S ribosomal protein L15 [Patescibacteria group bacterium]